VSPAIAARDLFCKKWIHKKSGIASPVGEEEEEEAEEEEGEEDAVDDGDGATGIRARRMKRRVEFHGSRVRPGRPSPSPPLHRLLFQVNIHLSFLVHVKCPSNPFLSHFDGFGSIGILRIEAPKSGLSLVQFSTFPDDTSGLENSSHLIFAQAIPRLYL
jgi:hypothetical protein